MAISPKTRDFLAIVLPLAITIAAWIGSYFVMRADVSRHETRLTKLEEIVASGMTKRMVLEQISAGHEKRLDKLEEITGRQTEIMSSLRTAQEHMLQLIEMIGARSSTRSPSPP